MRREVIRKHTQAKARTPRAGLVRDPTGQGRRDAAGALTAEPVAAWTSSTSR